jgi:membrane-bound inhibitor of C-type lysozyme
VCVEVDGLSIRWRTATEIPERGNAMKMSLLTFFSVLALSADSAFAADAVTFPLSVASSKDVHYICKDKKEIVVSYVNATSGDAFAYLPVDGTQHVFVGVTSGSGARYASGRYIWWNKGNSGALSVDGSGSAPLLADCLAQK